MGSCMSARGAGRADSSDGGSSDEGAPSFSSCRDLAADGGEARMGESRADQGSSSRAGEGAANGRPPARDRKPRPGMPPAKHFGLQDTHEVLDVLGTGGEGSAWLMREKSTGRLDAIKLIKRPVPKVLLPFLNQEIKIQAQLGQRHENIIDLYGVVLTPSFLAIVMEYAEGGPLTKYICKRMGHAQQKKKALFLQEDEALYLFKQFLRAVEFCHENGFAHRDLKLDNTLLTVSQPPVLKLSDFGFAKGSAEENTFTTIGTPCYMSPEVLNTRNTKEGYNAKRADVWASGVLLFAMLFGMFPFDSTDHDPNSLTTAHDILTQQLQSLPAEATQPMQLPGSNLGLLTPECKDLLQRMFQVDPEKRITLQQIKQHAWYNRPLPPGKYTESLGRIDAGQLKRGEAWSQRPALPPHFEEELEDVIARAAQPAPMRGGEARGNVWLRV